MRLIDKLTDGITQVNQYFIEHPDLTLDQYRAMTSSYLVEALLIELGYNTSDKNKKAFSFYSDPNIGYTGYIQLDNDALFFAPAKAIVLGKDENSCID